MDENHCLQENNFLQENLCQSNFFLTLLLHWVGECDGISGYLLAQPYCLHISCIWKLVVKLAQSEKLWKVPYESQKK